VAARVFGDRNRGPQSRIELAPKLVKQAGLFVREFHVALGDQNLTVPRLHPKKTHRLIMPERRSGKFI
jgi:hypothetical protein